MVIQGVEICDEPEFWVCVPDYVGDCDFKLYWYPLRQSFYCDRNQQWYTWDFVGTFWLFQEGA
jgi:hypothetical protein